MITRLDCERCVHGVLTYSGQRPTASRRRTRVPRRWRWPPPSTRVWTKALQWWWWGSWWRDNATITRYHRCWYYPLSSKTLVTTDTSIVILFVYSVLASITITKTVLSIQFLSSSFYPISIIIVCLTMIMAITTIINRHYQLYPSGELLNAPHNITSLNSVLHHIHFISSIISIIHYNGNLVQFVIGHRCMRGLEHFPGENSTVHHYHRGIIIIIRWWRMDDEWYNKGCDKWCEK